MLGFAGGEGGEWGTLACESGPNLSSSGKVRNTDILHGVTAPMSILTIRSLEGVTHLHGIPATDFQLPLQHRDHGKLRRCIRLEATTPALQSQLCGLCAELCDLAEVTETLCSHSFSLAIMREDHRLPQLYPKALCGANKKVNVEGKALHKR